MSLLWTVPCAAVGVLPVTVDLRARAFGPGEPMRVEVAASEPLERLEGRFLGSALFLVRAGDEARGGERWVGWTMIALDEAAGLAAVEVWGSTVSGRPRGAGTSMRTRPPLRTVCSL